LGKYSTISRIRQLNRRTRIGLTLFAFLPVIIALAKTPRIPLDVDYHNFADRRGIPGIPNALDTLSNIPFVVVGGIALIWLLRNSSRRSFVLPIERLPYLFFFSGVAATGVGSFWYHLNPNNSRLLFDLLPMTCCFMSMLTSIVIERIGAKVGAWLLPPLLLLGSASVAYWSYTQALGIGDYRFYLFVQFATPVLIVVIIALFPARYSHVHYLAIAFLIFVIAKLLEYFDRTIFSLATVSGHSMKHVAAAVSCWWILRMLQARKPVDGHGNCAQLW
jgi:hypothetical protein